jgi:hypothetical protein
VAALAVKAEFEAIDAGTSEFEEEFLLRGS